MSVPIFFKSYFECTNKTSMLAHTVIGCPVIEAPENSWTKESEGLLTVGCKNSQSTWKLRCIGNHWIGIMGNCSMQQETTMKRLNLEKKNTVFGLPSGIWHFKLMFDHWRFSLYACKIKLFLYLIYSYVVSFVRFSCLCSC